MSDRLAGRRIAITRPAESSAGLARRLEGAGATVLLAPAIRRGPPSSWEPLDRSIATMLDGGYAGLLFTSPAAVQPFCDRLLLAGGDPARLGCRALAGGGTSGDGAEPRVVGIDTMKSIGSGATEAKATRGVVVGAVGPGTAAALAAVGLDATVVPEKEDGASLAAAVARAFGSALGGVAFLQPRAEEGREELSAGLARRGARVDVVAAYRTSRAPDAELRPLLHELRDGRLDAVVFASPSAVDAVMDAAGPTGLGVARAVAIGDTTAGALRSRGLDAVSVAATADDEGLLAAVAAALR